MSEVAPSAHPGGGLLDAFVAAGVLDASAVHVAAALERAIGAMEPEVVLAAALAARAPRFGHVCIEPRTISETVVVDGALPSAISELPWPEPARWAALLTASPAVRGPLEPPGAYILPLVFDGDRCYLERYWRYEQRSADELLRRAGASDGLSARTAALDAVLDTLFGAGSPSSGNPQRRAVERALTRRLAVIAGGPGTGKTHTIACLLAAAHSLALTSAARPEIALAAPTGKAAARLTDEVRTRAADTSLPPAVAAALGTVEARTLHRLLGSLPRGAFRHDRANPLPHDIVVVDETSMVSLPLMARLLEAVRPDATLVLVGDPFQLASVEAGAVLGDIVAAGGARGATGPLAASVVVLDEAHRFEEGSAIAALAAAVRDGDADRAIALLRARDAVGLDWVDPGDQAGVDWLRRDAAAHAVEVVRAAQGGASAEGLRLSRELKVLCATRYGALGLFTWNDWTEQLVSEALPGSDIGSRRYVGRPILVTRNDYLNGVYNGDNGLVVARPAGEGDDRFLAIAAPEGYRELPLAQLDEVETWWAMTIHKSQGSEFERVIVTLPPSPSPILTRELLYTAITRARKGVALIAGEESLRTAIGRPVARTSGLGHRLRP